MATHNDIGKVGENLAKEYLENKGYKILACNFHYKKAEIDIIAQKGEILAVVEVKTRSSVAYGTPESFVNQKKIQLVMQAANAFVETHSLDLEISLDIISVVMSTPPVIEHIENAYYFF